MLFMLFISSWKFKLGQEMKLTREDFRVMIYYECRCVLLINSLQPTHDQLTWPLATKLHLKTTVYHWFSELNRDCRSLDHKFKECHPKSVVVFEKINVVHKLIMQDRLVMHWNWCDTHEIGISLSIGTSNIHKILHEHLVWKRFVCVVPV